MKLYFTPGTCSLSPHIVLRETGLPFEMEKVDLPKKKTESGADFYKINGKGCVPALQLDDGQILTEGPVIVQYLADLVPQKNLIPKAGTMERYRVMEWLNFITSELHKGFGTLFIPDLSAECKAILRAKVGRNLDWANRQLEKTPYLMGSHFTVADAYLYNILRWAGYVEVSLSQCPFLEAFCERMAMRPSVKEVLAAEGLKA